MNLALKVKQVCEANGWAQAEFAKIAGVPLATIQKLAMGEEISSSERLKIIGALNHPHVAFQEAISQPRNSLQQAFEEAQMHKKRQKELQNERDDFEL
jgi:transcriptional regulator with XRE-family HTH domain